MPAELKYKGPFSQLPADRQKSLIARAKASNVDYRRKVQHFIDAHQKLLTAPADSTYLGAAEVEFAVFIAYGILSFTVAFVGNPSGVLSFSGNDWSWGLGAWEGNGAAIFNLPPNQLNGSGSATVTALAYEEGGFLITCSDANNTQYGSITGVAEGGGVAYANISGSYSWAGN